MGHPFRLAALATMLWIHPAAIVAQQAVAAAPQAQGAAAQPSAEDLAKQLSNPVASLVSVPFQFNWDQPVGPDEDSRFVLNLQPVIPMGLNDDWNLILRWIMPFIGQPPLFAGGAPVSGMGDIVASLFFSPARPGAFIWGAGPVFLLPTNADPVLGTAKWGVGPTAVILRQSGGWTYGALANHVWSFAGDDFSGGVERGEVNASFVQPFLAYTTKSVVTYSVNLEASANWKLYGQGQDGGLEELDGSQWTVPMMFTITKLTRFGPLPMSIGGGVGFFLEAPNGQPDWRLRLVGTILLPRR